jgi:hypothetical protein
MSINQVEKKICFIVKGSLIDSVGQSIPYFARSTPTTISTKDSQGNTEIVRIDAYRPAISPKSGTIGIEPGGKNELTWNASPGNVSWIKGTNLSVDLSRKPGLDRTFYTSTLTWRAGTNASSQKIRKELLLEANTDYCLSAILKLTGGLFRSTDEIRVVGGVIGTASASLSVLNKTPQQQSTLVFKFKTTGGNPNIPVVNEDYLSIQAVQVGAVNVLLPAIVVDQLLGAQVKFTGVSETFIISGNTATSATTGIVTLTVTSTATASSLPALGVTVAGKLKISRPPLQQCFIELESRNDVSMEWGAIQVEAKSFPTALIFQQDTLRIRSRTELVYPDNPIASKSNCGLFVDIEQWQGDGVVFTSDAISLGIADGKLTAIVGGVSIPTTTDLPKTTKIFVNVSRIANKAFLFVDNKLAGLASLTNFTPPPSTIVMTSEGSRNYRAIVLFDDSLKDDLVDLTIGRPSKNQIAELFSSKSFGSAAIFRSRRPVLILPQVSIPGLFRPASINITGKNESTRTLSLDSIENIVVNKEVTITNQNIFILKATVIGIVGSSIILDAPIEIVNIGYQLRQGEVTFGRSIARFPWEPIDVQEIASINPIDNSLVLQSSALGFNQGKSIVQDSKDRFICEPSIIRVVPLDRKIYVDSIDLLKVGQRISQPRSELNIDPANYLATIIEVNPAVTISTLAQTGLVLSNGSDQPTEVTVSVSVFL